MGLVPQLKAELGLREATMLIIGSMIGSGILILPGIMLADVGSPTLVLLAWLLGAILTVAGALTFAELGTMFPRAGGQYVFLRESLGDRWAFLYGWSNFWVVQAGILAAVAVAFATFMDVLFTLPGQNVPIGSPPILTIPKWGVSFVAVACIWLLAAVNYFGTKQGGRVQVVFTVAKLIGIVGLLVAVVAFYRPSGTGFGAEITTATGFGLAAAFSVAMSRSLFAYDGWPVVTYVASEIKDPKKNIPRALVMGVGIVAVVYLAFTAAMMYCIPPAQGVAIGQNPQSRIATECAGLAFGGGAAVIIAIVAGISTFGTVNGYVLAAPRIFYAMAKDDMFFRSMAKLSRFATPGFATLLTVEWASILALTGVYATLAIMVVFGLWLFYIPTAIGYFRLRRDRPDADRPYRTPGYPWVPAVFLASAFFVTGTILLNPETRVAGLIGLALVATGFPAHAYFEKRKAEQRDLEIVTREIGAGA